jgi:hypothetical protein
VGASSSDCVETLVFLCSEVCVRSRCEVRSVAPAGGVYLIRTKRHVLSCMRSRTDAQLWLETSPCARVVENVTSLSLHIASCGVLCPQAGVTEREGCRPCLRAECGLAGLHAHE